MLGGTQAQINILQIVVGLAAEEQTDTLAALEQQVKAMLVVLDILAAQIIAVVVVVVQTLLVGLQHLVLVALVALGELGLTAQHMLAAEAAAEHQMAALVAQVVVAQEGLA